MAKLRNFVCYRDYKRPYTRFSKFKKYSYIRSRPANRIARYTSGTQDDFDTVLHLVTKNEFMSIRDNALESARTTFIRKVEKLIGKQNFFFQIRVYPHHILRENPLAAGAGADRLSTGMSHNYGKTIGVAAQTRKGQHIFTVRTRKEFIPIVRLALKKCAHKLPVQCSVTVIDLTAPVKKVVKKAPPKEAPKEKAAPKKAEKPAPKPEAAAEKA